MDGMTVRRLAREMEMPIDRLLRHLHEIGCESLDKDDLVTGQQQLLLLRHLQTTASPERSHQIAVGDLQAATTLTELNRRLTQVMARPQDIQASIKGSNLEAVVAHLLHLNRGGGQELLAAATLGRIANVARGERTERVLARVTEVFTHEPGPMEALDDGDGRTKGHAARALRYVDSDWVPAYSIREALSIDTADNARNELLDASLERQGSIAAWASAISSQATHLRQVPAASRPRRLRRILSVMDTVVQGWRGEVGSDVGKELALCLREFSRSTGLAEFEDAILLDVLDSILSILVRAIELRFSTAFYANTYEALNQAKRTVGVGRWGRFARASKVLPNLRALLLESALVLARQRRTDAGLAIVFGTAFATTVQASSAIRRHFKSARDLDPEIAEWWIGLGDVPDRPASQEQRFGNPEDSQIGALLIGVERNRDAMKKIDSAVLPLLEISDGVLASTVRRAVNGYKEVDQTIRRLARMRRLSTSDLVGKYVDYDPLEHELVGGHRPGVREVRVTRDGIQKDFGGRIRVLVKPWVEDQVESG